MNKNNKGFLLVETLITTCIIATLATSVYVYISSTVTNYTKRDKYENIVNVYKASNIKSYIYKKWGKPGFELSEPKDWDKYIKTINLPNSLKNELNVSSVFVVPNNLVYYSGNSIVVHKSDIINKTSNKAFKEYIRLLSFTGERTDYRLIVHFGDDTFASLVIKAPIVVGI